MVMVDITIVFMQVTMVYKPTYNWGALSCIQIGNGLNHL